MPLVVYRPMAVPDDPFRHDPVMDPAPPHRVRGRLSTRLAWVTVAAVLVAEMLFFVPSLSRARHDWLERRLREGQLAALAARALPPGGAAGADLLRLADVASVTLRLPGGEVARLSAGPSAATATALDLRQDTLLGALGDALGGIFRSGDRLLSVTGPSALGDASQVTVLVHRAELDRFLAAHVRRIGTISLAVAALAGLVLYGALLRLLVRPLRRLIAGIAAFRADPEHAGLHAPPAGDDEIALAERELAAMQREFRAALWRNARLAALGTAVAKISHDLRGILSPALLTAERLQMNEQPSIKRAGDTLVRAVERATELVRRTVEFAREVPLSPQRLPLRLRGAVAEAIEQVQGQRPELTVENAVADGLEIEAERESIVRVLANLLRNAGEAEARHARVAASEAQGVVVVTVSDDGPGLPEPVQAALFRPFVPGGRPGSTGLGLAIVRDLVRAHGGEAELLETGSAGTTFRLTLPRAARRVAPRPDATAQPPVEMRG